MSKPYQGFEKQSTPGTPVTGIGTHWLNGPKRRPWWQRLPHPWVSLAAILVYAGSIVLANWLIRHVGPIVIPGGDHLVPVGFGLPGVIGAWTAPTGVYAAGVTLVARDVTQRTAGRAWSLVIVPAGALLSALIDPQVALASGLAFLFSESVDFLVYTPLQRRGLVVAVFASVVVASVVDSLLFLSVAGIPLVVALPGLLLGKVEVALVSVPVIYALRRVLPSVPMSQRSRRGAITVAQEANP